MRRECSMNALNGTVEKTKREIKNIFSIIEKMNLKECFSHSAPSLSYATCSRRNSWGDCVPLKCKENTSSLQGTSIKILNYILKFVVLFFSLHSNTKRH